MKKFLMQLTKTRQVATKHILMKYVFGCPPSVILMAFISANQHKGLPLISFPITEPLLVYCIVNAVILNFVFERSGKTFRDSIRVWLKLTSIALAICLFVIAVSMVIIDV